MNVSQLKINNTIRPILISAESAPGLVFKKYIKTFTHKKSFRIDRQNRKSVTSRKLGICLFLESPDKQAHSNQKGWIEMGDRDGWIPTHPIAQYKDVQYARQALEGLKPS